MWIQNISQIKQFIDINRQRNVPLEREFVQSIHPQDPQGALEALGHPITHKTLHANRTNWNIRT